MNAEENCQKRLAADRERHAIARANESAEKRQKRLADERGKEVLLLEPMSFCVREVGFYNKVISLSCLQLRMITV